MANKQKTYRVSLSCVYNGYMNVKADNEDDALRKANEMLNCETLSEFPQYVDMPYGEFQFGEATADFIVSDQCASGVVREYSVMFCDEGIFGDDEEHEYDVDCADGAAVAHAKNEKDPQTLVLTYPKMDEVVKNVFMVDDIGDYCGLWASDNDLHNPTMYVIDGHNVDLLKNREIIGVWCYASYFAKKHKLRGFFTYMFVSNPSEAKMLNFGEYSEKYCNEQNVKFCNQINQLITENVNIADWTDKLTHDDVNFVNYNYKHLEYLYGY